MDGNPLKPEGTIMAPDFSVSGGQNESNPAGSVVSSPPEPQSLAPESLSEMTSPAGQTSSPEINQTSSQPGPSAVSESAPASIPETFVVPTADLSNPPESPPSAPVITENPLIPQGIAPVQPVQNPGGKSSLPGRILMVMVFLFLAVGLFFGGRFLMGMIAGPQKTTLTYWGLWEDNPVLEGVLADFEKQSPNVTVSYIKQSPQQYRERLQAAIDRGQGPDVFRFHNTWIAMLRNELSTVPATIMTPSEFSSTFYPVAVTNLVAGQTIYGIPMEIDGLGLYYNEDLFAAAGVTPPSTWEDVLNMVPKLTVKNGTTITTSAIALGTAGNVENFSDILATMMMQNGASLLTPTTKEAQEALTFYRKFADPSDPVYTWNDTLDNSIYAFANSKVAMILAPSWRAFDIKQMNPNLHFKTVPIPQLPGSTINWASYWVEGVSAKSQHQKEAWQLVKYMTSRDVVTRLYTEEAKVRLFGEPYARTDLASTITADPYVGAFIKEAPTAKSFPLASRTFDNGLNDKLIKYLTDAVNGLAAGSAPGAVLQTMSSGFTQVLSQYGLVTGAPAPSASP